MNISPKTSKILPAMQQVLSCLCLFYMGFLLSGCAVQQTHRTIENEPVKSYKTSYSGPKTSLMVSKFENRSNYLQGLFSSNVDQMGMQAKSILVAHLQQSNRFKVVDRDSLSESKQEAELLKQKQKILGARYVITGAVSEFGRSETGDKQLYGILGSGKKQIAYAKVTLNVVDVLSSEVVFSVQGAGEYVLSEREVIGFGSKAGYDATLNGKVLNLAITEAVNKIVDGVESQAWRIEE